MKRNRLFTISRELRHYLIGNPLSRIKFAALFLCLFLISSQAYSRNFLQAETPYLTVIGNISMADGIGKQSAELIQSFHKEFSIGFVHTRKPDYNDFPSEILPNVTKKKALGNVLLLEDLIWCPQVKTYELILSKKRDEQLLLAYSVFESDQIPSEWVSRLNAHFDAVAVADPFLIDAYQRSGVTIPIFELPLGLDLKDFLSEPLKRKANQPIFTFGALSFGSHRKNLVKLVQGFGLAFKNNPLVKLRINCRGTEQIVQEGILNEIRRLRLTNVEYSVASLNKDDYINLFKSLDCFVTVSKGEGFSIQPREAMALGIPVIATNNTAQITICNSSLVKSIPSKILIPANYKWLGKIVGNFFDCRVEDIAQALKAVYYNYEEYLKNGEQAREWASQYDYPNLLSLYRSFLKPEQIELGNENRLESNKLITNSPKLYEKYAKIISKNY